MAAKRKLDYQVTEGNIFEDLGLPDPDILEMKTELAFEIQRLVKQKKLTQSRVAEMTNLTQPNVSALMNAKLQGFSLERLIETATKLGSHVELKVNSHTSTSKPRARAIGNQHKQLEKLAEKVQEATQQLKKAQRLADPYLHEVERSRNALREAQAMARRLKSS